MKISQAISSTLLVAITEALQDGQARHSIFKFPDGWEQQTRNAVGEEFSKALSKALDGSSLVAFLGDRLKIIMAEQGIAFPKEGAAITSLKCFKDPLKTSREILEYLQRLPIQYRIIVEVAVELSSRVSRGDVDIHLSERLRLTSGALIKNIYNTAHSNETIDGIVRGYFGKSVEFEIFDESLYLEYRASGYLSDRDNSRVVGDFYDEIRAFYGACITYDIIFRFGSFFVSERAPYLIANSSIDDVNEFAFFRRPEDDIIKCANLGTTGITDDFINEGNLLEELLKPVVLVFRSESAARLKTACSWLLRAQLSSRNLDKVLESAITIEVLMGDRDTSDRIGLTKLIANRCAYALGSSVKERDEIIELFVRFYKVRSEVVHSGRTMLQPDEQRIVNEGLTLATRILRHEIDISNSK